MGPTKQEIIDSKVPTGRRLIFSPKKKPLENAKNSKAEQMPPRYGSYGQRSE